MNTKTGGARGAFNFMKQLWTKINADDVQGLGAQLTYYLILSLFPFLIFIMTLIGYANISLEDKIHQLEQVMPAEAISIIEEILQDVSAGRSQALLSFGMLATLWAASKGVNAIIKGLNRAYDIDESRAFWKIRGIALLATLTIGLVVLLSILLLVLGTWLKTQVFLLIDLPYGFQKLWDLLQYAIPLLVMFIVFTLLYWIAPSRRLALREVVPGALFSTIGWITTSVLFSVYVNQFSDFTKTYGSLGGVTVLLIWLYISSFIILAGGEINAVLLKRKADGK
ncbi:YihY/virulence factor BrkB family protein [Paenibacillus tritici]|uniref:YihY/virulence factor BrkB family protein n=1 Tax=Paenibacillus tritici TaxID=1873425 RepID=A0ABX2DTK7_9BACL|nr:YihY/virulence factor BrkB family protein [Paenibacillus tritici]NQX48027.1 YihY/virulence factor BrkB family protein [Paenibacillus tritici]QUL57023.1 YihY/virulence factor BrkB family protein [Paenibacillus tritici]